ncbi:MAG: hypothetical protein U0Z44_06255 [Kouleothrix sp.]
MPVQPHASAEQIPAIALQDGTLVRWTLAGAEKFVQDQFLLPYLRYLDAMQARGIPVSYISRPRAPEVAGADHLMFCPDVDLAQSRGAKCNACLATRPPSACRRVWSAGPHRRRHPGRYAGRWPARAAVRLAVAHQCRGVWPTPDHFFYMRVGREIARVRLPLVADDRAQVRRWFTPPGVRPVYARPGLPGGAGARPRSGRSMRAADRRAFLGIVEGDLLRAGKLPASDSRKRE